MNENINYTEKSKARKNAAKTAGARTPLKYFLILRV